MSGKPEQYGSLEGCEERRKGFGSARAYFAIYGRLNAHLLAKIEGELKAGHVVGKTW